VVTDIRFAGATGRKSIMIMTFESRVAYLSNYGYWKRLTRHDTEKLDFLLSEIVTVLSHETVHMVVNELKGRTACRKLDRVSGHVGHQDHSGMPWDDETTTAAIVWKQAETDRRRKMWSGFGLGVPVRAC
jgi:hypothetical protein